MAFSAIAWEQPWLGFLRELGEPLARHDDWISAAGELAAVSGLHNLNGQAIRFVPQQQLPADTPYEAHIAATGEVPTRDNLHDFFNALAWLHMPCIKRELNALHAQAFTLPAAAGTRGGLRDAATLFDENAALFVSSDPSVLHALREHDWKRVLLKPADAFFSSCDVVLFGHALVEKLLAPYKSITAHVWTVPVEPAWFGLSPARRIVDLDARVATRLHEGFRSADFCHLPVMGVPGWCRGQDLAFYEEAEVFRPKRIRTSSRQAEQAPGASRASAC